MTGSNAEMSFARSAQLVAESAKHIAGGINSNFRIGMAGGPLVFQRGEGAYQRRVIRSRQTLPPTQLTASCIFHPILFAEHSPFYRRWTVS